MDTEHTIDHRQEGELDLADIIDSFLWDACDSEDGSHLEAISEAALNHWEQRVRSLVERYGVNLYWKQDGTVRRQSGIVIERGYRHPRIVDDPEQ